MSMPSQEHEEETLLEKIVEHTLAGLAPLNEWDGASLADLKTLLAGPTTPLPETLVAAMHKRGSRSNS